MEEHLAAVSPSQTQGAPVLMFDTSLAFSSRE